MYDPARIWYLLGRIEEAIILIQANTSHINHVNDFLSSSEGVFTMSGVCMQLIFIGESVKVIDSKTQHQYLPQYPNIPWTNIMGLRDIIAHEYQHIDAEEIFNVVKKDLPILLETIRFMKTDL